MSRSIIFTSLLAAIAVVAIWFAVRDREHRTAAPPAGVTPVESVQERLARVPALPPPHRAEVVRTKLDGLADWLVAAYPQAQTEFLGADCASPPCLIGVRFVAKGLASPADVRGLLHGVRSEIERRLGIKMSVVHSDEDTEGRDYLWMYGLPDELAVEHRETLRASAEQRYSRRMDALRPPIEQHVPDPGEPGYTGG